MFVQVTFNSNSRKAYTYLAPADMCLQPGDVVEVPVRSGRYITARVVAVSENPLGDVNPSQMKCVEDVVRRAQRPCDCTCPDDIDFQEMAANMLAAAEKFITEDDKVAILRRKAVTNCELQAMMEAYDVFSKMGAQR